jgi:Asp-tRNA(Asn)/Glu-tRNA(Gln) amidotransferase A subunit family amidase
LEAEGYQIRPVQIMPDFAEIRSRHQTILAAEAAQVHAEWFEKYEKLYSLKFTELVRRGQQVSPDQLRTAVAGQEQFQADMRRALPDHDIDLWICPSTVGAAPRGLDNTGDPVMNLPWTQAGLPVISLPAGKNREGLPLGLQLVGNWHKDESLLFWARDFQRVLSNL